AGERKADVKVVLEPGPNTLLVKLTRQGPLGLRAQFLKPDGSLLDGLEVEREINPPADKADATVALREGVKDVVEISQETGQPVQAAFDTAAGRLAVSLEPGEGRLFRLEHTDPARAAAAPTAPAAPKTPAPVALRLDPNTGVVLEADRNGLPAGTTMFSTAACMDYSLLALVDGVKDRKTLGWQGGAWASLEDQNPHGLEIRLAKPVQGGCLRITWAFDRFNPENGHVYASRNYCIQVKGAAGEAWKTVADVKGNSSSVSTHPLPNEPFRFLRLYQLPGGGDVKRPNILWIGQLERVDAPKE
ncbi:MAG: discoidin domain-containing protein, partial [Planctomycetota bacterium]|nr:discoidin domain-containing protein [Planctomycetota bacterium]